MVQTYNAICRYACFVWALDSAVEGLLDELDEDWKKKYFKFHHHGGIRNHEILKSSIWYKKKYFFVGKLAFCKEYNYSTTSCLRFKEEYVLYNW